MKLIVTGLAALTLGFTAPLHAQDAGPQAPMPPPPPDEQQQVQVVEQPLMEPPQRAPNSIYIEGLGAGLWYSVNYERLVVEDLAVRIGVSFVPLSASASSGGTTTSSSVTNLSFPLTASYLGIGGDKHIFEIGGGLSLNYVSGASSSGVSSASGSGILPVGVVFAGYRIHPFDGAGFNFRVGAMALIAQGFSLSSPDPEALGVLPWFYLSMGASF